MDASPPARRRPALHGDGRKHTPASKAIPTPGVARGVAVLVTLLFIGSARSTWAQLRAESVVTGLSAPVAMVQDPTNPSVQFVVEQRGRIRVVRGGALEPTDFLNLSASIASGGERGLLGLAAAPDYASTGRFFVNFTNPSGHTVIARFLRSRDNPLVADASTRFDLRWPGGSRFISQPFSNHNGGTLVFGPDGYLYVGMGDGGSGNDPGHRAQSPTTLLGKMLRINVGVPDSDPDGYEVPPDNPFLDGDPIAALPEIWAFGLRNPWKFSFDDPAGGGTGALFIADVGQNSREEVNHEPAGQGGRNYGWRNREGTRTNVTSLPPAYGPLTSPILEYERSVGRSITGGFVYRGRALGREFRGRYFFADFITGRVWSVRILADGTGGVTAGDLVEHTAELGGRPVLGMISSFGVDADGELFILSHDRGVLLRLLSTLPAPPEPDAPTPPERPRGRLPIEWRR
jgi:glucose/arabinose dehydrogenase